MSHSPMFSKKGFKAVSLLMAIFLVGAVLVGVFRSSPPTSIYAAAPTGASAVIQNSSTSWVDIVITGTDFDHFSSSGTATANATDLLGIAYNSKNPTSATIDSPTTITATFPILMGTGKTGGSLTIAANTVEDATDVPNALITIVDGSITDSAQPILSSAYYFDSNADGKIDRIVLNFWETVNFTYAPGDWAFSTAGDMNLIGDFLVGDCSGSPGATITCTDADNSDLSADPNETGLQTGGGVRPVWDYTNNSNNISDGVNHASSFSRSVGDGASPIIIARKYLDNGGDGTADRLEVGFSEAVNFVSNVDQFQVTANDLTGFALGWPVDGSGTKTLTITMVSSGKTGVSGGVEPTLRYVQNIVPANRVVDLGNNELPTEAAPVSISDGAAPVIKNFEYHDNDYDGKIDRIMANFSEQVTGASVLAAKDLTFSNVGDFTGAAFGADGNDLLLAGALVAQVDLGTEANVIATHENSGNLAIATQDTFSLTDGVNVNGVLGAQPQATYVDKADPMERSLEIEDTNADGLIDKITILWSENVDTADGNPPEVSDLGSLILPDGSPVTMATISDPAGASDQVVLTSVVGQLSANTALGAFATGGANNLWTDNFGNVTAHPLDNAVYVDSAAPAFVSATMVDNSGNDGRVDSSTLVFSENLTDTAVGANGFDVSSGGVHGTCDGELVDPDGTNTLGFGFACDAVNTAVGDLTISFISNAGLKDAADNQVASKSLSSASSPAIADDANPILVSATLGQGAGKNRITFVYSESITISGGNGPSSVNRGNIVVAGAVTGFGSFGTAGDVTVTADKNTLGGSGTATITLDLAGESGGVLTSALAQKPGGTFTPVASATHVHDAANLAVNVAHTVATTDGTWDLTKPTLSSLSDGGATDKRSGDTVTIIFNMVEVGGQTAHPTVNVTQSNDTLIGAATYTGRTGAGTGGDPFVYTYAYTVPAGNYLNTKVKVDATDDAGNVATQVVLSPAFNIDNTASAVSNVTSLKANGTYGAGEVIDVTVQFNEVVAVVGIPQLTLETGATDRVVDFLSGSDTDTLTFRYTVQAGDASSDLDYVATTSLALNGGSIRDTAGNDATLTLPTPGAAGSLGANKALVIDASGAPTVTGVSSGLANGSYKAGQLVPVTVTFSKVVDVITTGGTPSLLLETGATDRSATYASGTGNSTLTFNYTVQAGDASSDLDYVATNSLVLNGGTIRDAVSDNAVLTLASPGAPGSLGNGKSIVIDTSASTVSNVTSTLTANGTYTAGAHVYVSVQFNENVVVTGLPQLLLETGSTDRNAVYDGGGGTSTLVFDYIVQAGDASSDLDYFATTSLALNGGTIRDAAGNDATLILPAPGAAGSLGANKAIVIETANPAMLATTQVEDTNGDGTDDKLTIYFSQAVNIIDANAGDGLGSLALSGGCVIPNAAYGATGVSSLAVAGLTGCTAKNTAMTPTVTYAHPADCASAGAICSAAGNALGAGPVTSLDRAAPQIKEVRYQDAVAVDGKIDQVTLTFTEPVTAASTLAARDLAFVSLGDFTGMAFGSSATDLITGTVSSVAIPLGTASTVVGTASSTDVTIRTQNNFSLTDGTTGNTTLADQTQASSFDGAAPYLVSATYSDPDWDGMVSRVVLEFSESTTFTSNGADWAFPTNGDVNLGGWFDPAECSASPSLTYTCTDAGTGTFEADPNKTGKQSVAGVEPVMSFTDTGAAHRISDGAGNATSDFTATLVDGAKPMPISATLNYTTGALAVTMTEVVDATPATQVDLTKFHVNNATGVNAPLASLSGATATATDGKVLNVALTNAQKTTLRATSGVQGGDGGANILDVENNAFWDVAAVPNQGVEILSGVIAESAPQGALSPASVSPANSVVSQITSFTISFTPQTPIPSDGKIRVIFPAQFNVSSAEGLSATGLSGISGTLTASVSGLAVTFTRGGAATQVDAGVSVSFVIAGGLNGSTVGVTDPFTIRTLTSGGTVLDENTAVAGATLATATTPTTTITTNGGGGGGGGGGSAPAPSPTSNTSTSTIASSLSSVVSKEATYSRPIQVPSNLITANSAEQTKTAELTTETGSIQLQPNTKSTVAVTIPPSTTVTAPFEWDGRIQPPLVQSITKVSVSGDVIEGSTDKLARADVAAIVKVGSDKATLTFSNPVTLEIPVEGLEDGAVVAVYSSSAGHQWTYEGTAVVQGGKAVIQTSHFTYFALKKGEVPTVEVKGTTPESVVSRSVRFLDIAGHWAEGYIQSIAEKGIVNGKTSVRFAPDDSITRAELVKIAVNAFGVDVPTDIAYKPFADVELDAWYAKYIVAARMAGMVSGSFEGQFNPDRPVNRAEALKILISAAGFGDLDSNFEGNYASNQGWTYVGFKDVPISAWFGKFVAYAKDFGFVGGYDDGLFHPERSMTRAEAVKVLMKVMELKAE